jgi:hypothetical protein
MVSGFIQITENLLRRIIIENVDTVKKIIEKMDTILV